MLVSYGDEEYSSCVPPTEYDPGMPAEDKIRGLLMGMAAIEVEEETYQGGACLKEEGGLVTCHRMVRTADHLPPDDYCCKGHW
jgi:hypothetical protein